MKNQLLKSITDLTIYTGTYGRTRCTCSCIGCTQENYGRKFEDYEGTIEHIHTIIRVFPNLENAYLLGNPDVSVDTEFCNKAAREFAIAGKKVMFSTSGFRGLDTVIKLTEGLDQKSIAYISFSIDSRDQNKMRYLKGNGKYFLKDVDDAISYCLSKGIKVKIQPTLWKTNEDDYKEIIEYYYNKFGIDWFTFHAGSFEALRGRKLPLMHIEPKKWREIVEDITNIAKEKNLRILVPKIFLDEKQYKEYKDTCSLYCQHGGSGLQLWIREDGIKATLCPLLAEVSDNFVFDIEHEEPKFVKCNTVSCSVCNFTIGEKLLNTTEDNNGKVFNYGEDKLYNVCRFYSVRDDNTEKLT